MLGTHALPNSNDPLPPHPQTLTDAELFASPILVYGNKCDLPGAATADDIIAGLRLNSIQREWTVRLCSANAGWLLIVDTMEFVFTHCFTLIHTDSH